LCSALPAAAQIAPSGPTFLTVPGVEFTGAVRGTATAYDPRNNDFLVVAAAGPVKGRIVKADGTLVATPFPIDMGTGFSQFPAVAFSPDGDSGRGAFLVTWHSPIPVGNTLPNRIHYRLVSATGTLLGVEGVLGTEATWWEAAPNVAYATGSQVFMVTWSAAPAAGGMQIRAARVDNSGQALDAAGALSAGILVSAGGIERDASIAYNPDTDNFLVVYRTYIGQALSRLVSASSASLGAIQQLGGSTSVPITNVTYSAATHQYLAAWYLSPGGTTGRLVNADGTPAGSPTPLSTRFGTYDSLGLAANPVTGTSLMVGHDAISYENGGVEIGASGLPGSSSVLTNTGNATGNFYPVTASSTTEPKWLLSTSRNFGSMIAQFVTTAGTINLPTVNQKPVVTQNPGSVLVLNGATFTLKASASGSPAPTVLWQVSRDNVNWQNISGGATATTNGFGTSTTLIQTVHRFDSGKLYRAVFTNGAGETIGLAARSSSRLRCATT